METLERAASTLIFNSSFSHLELNFLMSSVSGFVLIVGFSLRSRIHRRFCLPSSLCPYYLTVHVNHIAGA